ncbi:MAG: energy transducer TonB [Sphingomonadales bacterium]|jgi:protein TonB|tara:strand:- start:13 stop:405 length:393 start_codon:yes stop_codon:yes gene_type:complete
MIPKNTTVTLLMAAVLFITGPAFGQQSVMDQDGNYLVCEKMPEIKGGLRALQNKIRYPLQAKTLGVQGVVYVQFIVTEEGAVDAPIVIRKLGAGCDKEALRVLKKVQFIPGYDKGKAVKVRFTLPVRFVL